MNTRHLLAASALAILALSAPALAQNALGGGRALDRNLNTSQPNGGVNPQVNDLQAVIRYNNAVAFGTAPGGRSLNAPLGYRGDSGFGAPLSGDSMFRFNRDSYSSLRNPQLGGSLVTGPAPTTGDSRTRDSYSYRAPTNPGGLPPRGSQITDYRQPGEALVGFARDDQGRTFTARTSSLRGLTYEPDDRAPSDTTTTPANPSDDTTKIRTSNRTTHDDILRGYGSTLKKPIEKNDLPPSPPDTPRAGKPAEDPDVEKSLQRLRNRLLGAVPSPLHDAPKPSTTASPIARDPKDTVLDGSRGIPSGASPSSGDRTPARGVEGAVATESDIQALRDMNLRLDTLVPKGATVEQAYSGYMTLAQEALAGGRYGFADNMFEQALSRRPDDVMARVGRIHASMGLGLLSTSGFMLRNLLTDSPEMIGVRYQPTLLMPKGRANTLVESLQAEIAKGDNSTMPDEAALNLAYLGRHFDQPEWTSQGLAALKARADKDPANKAFSDILQGAWAK